MLDIITYGFLIPPRGKVIDLSTKDARTLCLNHFDVCSRYIQTKLNQQQREAYEKFCYKNWRHSSILQNDSCTDFCIQVLGWCKVGNSFPSKVITFTGKARWHDEIYNEYKSYGFHFDFVPEVKLSTLI